MEPIFVETTLDVRDWDALQRYIRGRFIRRSGRSTRFLIGLVAGIATAATLIGVDYLTHGRVGILPIAMGLAFGVVLMLVAARIQMSAWRPAPQSSWFTPTKFRFDPAGIRAEKEGQVGLVEWRGVLRFEETAEHLFFAVTEYTAYIIPKRMLTTVSPSDFVARVQAWYSQAQREARATAGNAPPDVSVPLPAFVHERGFLRDLAGNLRAGTRMFFLGDAKPSDFTTGFWQIVGLLLVAVVIELSFDVSQITKTSEFYYWGFYSWITCALLVIWVSALITRALNPRTDSRVMVIAALSMAPWAIVTFWLISLLPDPDRYIFPVLISVVVFILGMRVTRVAHGTAAFSSFAIMAVTATLVALAINSQFLYTRIWPDYGNEAGEMEVSTSDHDWQAAESLLFDQPELIDDAVAALAPERPGVADVFFVGFAGDGSERVFRREVLFAQKAFAERMGSGERSIELINDKDDRVTYPLGTAPGLRHALIGLAGRMNVEEDILVLMLTSHGSADDGIHVENGSLPLNSMDPEAVLRALDASGIKWRIVIVSACYSGTFIEPLENDNTIVITASDADSTSFGCADDRDLTYFGEAFLRDALPKASSLEEAFERARNAIIKREKVETLDQSSPQIFVGDAIREKLASLGDLPFGAPAVE